MTDQRPKYSICIPNYNNETILQPALRSILDQLDERFEVIVVDDGSSDNSLQKLRELESQYDCLTVYPLERKASRRLGETRNVSIRHARGEYIILHLDADDIWEPYLLDWLEVFHKLEAAFGRPVFVQGQQIAAVNRDFIMPYGPYRNTFAEDRDLWHRLAADNAYVLFDHTVFRERMVLPQKNKLIKVFRVKIWSHLIYEFRRGASLGQVLWRGIRNLAGYNPNGRKYQERVARFLLTLPAWVRSKFDEPLPMPSAMPTHEGFVTYRETNRGSYKELMQRCGADPSLEFLRPEARRIFEE